MEIMTKPEEFEKFHRLLTKDNSEYEPFYFPLETNGKDPISNISWKKNRRTYDQALELMHNGYNIGIAATDKDKLVIVDVDDLEVVGEIKPTLTNQSRKRIGRHGFYFSDDKVSNNVFDNSAKQNIATEDYGEVRSNWQYVVAPGSYVPCAPEEIERIPETDRANAGLYTVMIEHSVSNITYDELPQTYRTCLENKREAHIAATTRKDNKRKKTVDDTNGSRSAMWDLTVHDIFDKSNSNSARFPSPFHGSKTYKDTSINHDLLHCWRHNVSHNALSCIAVMSGLSTCSQAGHGHNGGGIPNIDYSDGEVQYTLWRYAKDNAYIPQDDPMPSKALAYYAAKEGYCNVDDVEDEWKLPTAVYNEVIKTDDFNTGRKKLNDNRIQKRVKESINDPMDIAMSLQQTNPIWFDRSRNIWMWDNDLLIYNRIDETDVLCQINSVMEVSEIYKSHVKNEIMESIRITGRYRNVQETPRTWIQFHNTVVDIENMNTFRPRPEYFHAAKIPHDYGTSDDTPTIDKLFTDWVGEEHKETLYEICAYCLFDSYPIHRIFTLIGTGRNGKGQFMTLLRRFIGVENCVSTDLDRIASSRFETAKLYKKKAAFIGETNFSTMSRTNMLKMLSGEDSVPGEFKGRDGFDFVNHAKIVIATNSLPETTDKTEGFYRRWMIIDFCNKFQEGKDIINEIPEKEYANLCKKCTTKLNRLIKEGKFTNEGSISERAAMYEAKSNPLNKFIEDTCILDVNAKTPHWFIYEKFKEHCEVAGHRILTKKEFTQRLKSSGYSTKPQCKFNTELVKLYKGDNNEIKPANWMAIEGFMWNFDREGRQGSQSSHEPHSVSHIRRQSEKVPTLATSTTYNNYENIAIVRDFTIVPIPHIELIKKLYKVGMSNPDAIVQKLRESGELVKHNEMIKWNK